VTGNTGDASRLVCRLDASFFMNTISSSHRPIIPSSQPDKVPPWSLAWPGTTSCGWVRRPRLVRCACDGCTSWRRSDKPSKLAMLCGGQSSQAPRCISNHAASTSSITVQHPMRDTQRELVSQRKNEKIFNTTRFSYPENYRVPFARDLCHGN